MPSGFDQTIPERDHGGGLDAAVSVYGGKRSDWIDLSTGISPVAYPVSDLPPYNWTALPDQNAQDALLHSARTFWSVPDTLDILAVSGLSAVIAQLPRLWNSDRVWIPAPTYNEHAASFQIAGWELTKHPDLARVQVLVNPNNPDGRRWERSDLRAAWRVIDESFCDLAPETSLLPYADETTIVLKSFGKFWGLAGLRLGFVIASPKVTQKLAQWLGPWPVSGPALAIGQKALNDAEWAQKTRQRLATDAARLDALLISAGAHLVGGTDLFRLVRVDSAQKWQNQLANKHIWTRTFPYSDTWLRVGMPAPDQWNRLEVAL